MLRQAIILAGGLGTRFRSVREDIPKPLAPVAGRPVLEHQIAALREASVTDVVLCVGHKSKMIEEHFGDGASAGVRIHYAYEEQLLGTGGAILNARPFLRDEMFCVLNGDSLLCEMDYADLAKRHYEQLRNTEQTVGTLVVLRPTNAGQFGVVDVDATTGQIHGFREKAPVDPTTALISGGVYILQPNVFDFIAEGRPVSVEYEVFPQVLEAKQPLWAYEYDGFFGDIGTPEGYDRVNRHLEKAGGRA